MSETIKMAHNVANLNAKIILVVTVYSVRYIFKIFKYILIYYRLLLPSLPPGISVPVFTTKMSQDVKLI